MELSLPVLAVLVVGALDLIVAGVIVSQRPKGAVNLSFAIFALSGSCWALGISFFLGASDPKTIDFFARLLYTGGSCVTITFYYFAVTFRREAWPSRFTTTVVTFAALLLFVLYFFTDLMLQGYLVSASGMRGFSYGPLHFLFDIVLWTFFAAAIYTYYTIYRESDHQKGIQALVIMIGTVLNVSLATATNIVGPSFFNYFDYLWVGPFAMVVWIASVAYAVSRYQFFSMRVISAELFVISLWLFLLLRFFLSSSTEDFLINGASFLVVLVLGLFVVRSVIHEVEQREAIERLSQEKSEFMTFASHEIRNPITAMRGLASLIVDGTTGPVPPDTRDAAQKILVAGHDVLNIIATYLSKSKMELGQIAYDKAVFDLGEAASSIAEGYAPHAEVKGLTLENTIDRSHKYLILGDQGKIKEVIGNLIDNSLKYTKQGGLKVAVERHGPFVRAVISDTGVGIPKETIPQLFKKFSRADAQKVNLLGTGIGLYLAKTFIEAQGGRIWAESDGPGKGARFIVEFQAAQP